MFLNSGLGITRLTLAASIAAFSLIYLLLGPKECFVFVIPVSVASVYFIMKPRYMLNPANMVFAFTVLFLVIPLVVDRFYVSYSIPYSLPWGRLWDWSSLSVYTYIEAILIFYFLFFVFAVLTGEEREYSLPSYNVNNTLLRLLLVITVSSVSIFVYKTGGVVAWLFNYKETYLLGREGLGLINIFNIMMGSLTVFLLGLKYRGSFGWNRVVIFLFSMFFVLLIAYFQGLKSRLLILLFLFFSSYVVVFKFTWFKVLMFGAFFFVLVFFMTYIRSDGYYSSPLVFLEYTMTYFNVYPLHDLIVKSGEMSWFSTTHQLLVKPGAVLGIHSIQDFDLNVMLTKEYFPNDWSSMKATQQWPLITDMRFNYYGFVGGWLPLLAYAAIMVFLYKKSRKGNPGILLIFVLEFFRIFSVLRGTLIPWQVFIYVPMYMFLYLTVNFVVAKRS